MSQKQPEIHRADFPMNLYNHVPVELIRHILTFNTVNFNTTNQLATVRDLFGRFNSEANHHYNKPFLIFPSIIFQFHHEDDEQDNHLALFQFTQQLSAFHRLIFLTAIPFEHVLLQFSQNSNVLFKLWSDNYWKELPPIPFNTNLKLHFDFTCNELSRQAMDGILDELIDKTTLSGVPFFSKCLKSMKIKTCSRFRNRIIEEYASYFSQDETEENDDLMKGKKLFMIDLLNSFENLETLVIDKMVDDQDVESALSFETSKSSKLLSHESVRMTQYFKIYPFKSNKQISEIRMLLSEEDEEAHRLEQEQREERRKLVLDKLCLRQNKSYKLHTCLVNGLKEHELTQILQNHACQSSLKTILLAHTKIDETLGEMILHSSIETLNLSDCLIENPNTVECLLCHGSTIKVLSLRNVTYRKTAPPQLTHKYGTASPSSPTTGSLWSGNEGMFFLNNRQLVKLYFDSCTSLFDGKFVEKLSHNKQLRILSMRNCKLTDEKIRPILRNSTSIQEFDICNNRGGNITPARLIAYHCFREATLERMRIICN